MKKLIVLLIYSAFDNDKFGGIETSLFNLAKGLKQNKATPIIYTGKPGVKKSIQGIKIIRSKLLPHTEQGALNMLKKNQHLINDEIKNIIVENRVSIIHSHQKLWGVIGETEFKNFYSIPALITLHVPTTDLAEIAEEKWDGVATCSLSLKNYLIKRYKNLKINYILPNSIDLSVFSPQKYKNKRSGDLKSRVNILANCRIVPFKGVRYLVEAMKYLKDIKEIKLYLCRGKSSFMEQDRREETKIVLSLIKKYGLKQYIKFLPVCNWDKMPERIAEADITVQPSIADETFCMSILESIAMGVPPIVTNVWNLPSLVGEAGLIIKPKSPKSIAMAIKNLISNGNLYTTKSKLCLLQAQKYSIQAVSQQHIEVYNKIINFFGKHD